MMRFKVFAVFIALMMFSGIAVASTPGINISAQFSGLCSAIKNTVPIVAFTMLLIAAIVYASGQVMGAETRARANVWATAMVTGGIIGLLIASAAPYIIFFFGRMFTGLTVSGSFDSWCP